MRFMNDMDIEQAEANWGRHPVLGPAVRTLQSLQRFADANSDGWAYWAPPVRAAAKLMELVERDGTAKYAFDRERTDATAAELRKALAPVKAFRTRVRQGGRWGIKPGAGLDFKVYDMRGEV